MVYLSNRLCSLGMAHLEARGRKLRSDTPSTTLANNTATLNVYGSLLVTMPKDPSSCSELLALAYLHLT